ncbi:MAG: TerB family tellurite resistance protein [Candidatus Latescibacterota bacterium]|nr:MAG: TerB family tellurite resistance protein [Candidatus Latescibacterota bacterium]
MIDLIKKLIGTGAETERVSRPVGESVSKPRHHNVHLATCAIFLEMANIDGEFDETEREHILAMLQSEYDLPKDDVVELKKASREELKKSLDLWKFTNAINQHYSNEEKSRIVELLWGLVYADGRMDEHENYFMHKLAKLLRITHRDLIDAKLRVLERNKS